jgi:hypothetical protein
MPDKISLGGTGRTGVFELSVMGGDFSSDEALAN